MRSNTLKGVGSVGRGARMLALLVAVTAWPVSEAAAANKPLRIPVGRAEVVTADDEIRTVAIAEPKIADATVGSERTVVVSAKSAGRTTLIVYTANGRWQGYDVDVYVPNGEKQVALHVKIAEVTENASRELGFDFWGRGNSDTRLRGSLVGGLFPTKVTGPTSPLIIGPLTDGFIGYARNDGSWELQTVWRALEEKGDIRVLANPTLVAQSGKEAKFLAGGEFPVPIASNSGSSSGGGTAITVTIEWKEFGVKVDFTPTVEEDGRITLKVDPEVSQLDFTNPLALTGFNLPTVVTRKSSTTVNLAAGEYLAIGGLKQTEQTRVVRRVPILGHIPLLGFFFSNSEVRVVERELVVLVTPDIVEGGMTQEPALPTDRPMER